MRGFSRAVSTGVERALALALALVLALTGAVRAQAAPALPDPSDLVGYDVSWPQCGRALPDEPAFAIVGVNNGLANTTNPCLAAQLEWARTATGTTSQPNAALYVNTANPGHLGSWWPESNYYPLYQLDYFPLDALEPVPNPYGVCAGGEDAACAYMYGYAKAYDNATIRGVPDPASFFWWLDVETMNTWRGDKAANRAVLEGMTYYYTEVLGARGVGVYSTGYQWFQIVGALGPVSSGTVERGPSNLNGLPSWLAGATTLEGARRNCSRTSLTGGAVTVTQYVTRNLDHNHACV